MSTLAERRDVILGVANRITELVCESGLDVSEAYILLTVLKAGFEKTYGDSMPMDTVQ